MIFLRYLYLSQYACRKILACIVNIKSQKTEGWENSAKNAYIKNRFQAQASVPSNKNLYIKYCAACTFIHITVFTLCCFKFDARDEL